MTGTNQGKNFGEILKEFRESKGLSMYDLEKAVGISPAYVSRLETKNRDNISMYYFAKLAKYLKIPASVILELYPDSFIENDSKSISTLDELIIKNNFIFAERESNIDIKLSLQKVIQELEKHIVSNTRDSESKLLREIDRLKERFSKTV